MPLRDELAKYFPAGYWTKWESQFGHQFFDAHMERTQGYDEDFVREELSGKNILEIGGFPGLLIALYLFRGCEVVAIDSPKYRPDYYLELAEQHFFYTISHDINLGPPPLSNEEHYDAAVMSDVLLHNEGFPSDFMKWVIDHCDKVYILNYSGASDEIRKAAGHNLETGFPLPGPEQIIIEMERLGGKFVYMKKTSGRDLLVFSKENKDEIFSSNTTLREQLTLIETLSESGAGTTNG